MPDISEMRHSSFVTKADLGPNGSVFTITGCEQVNVAKDGAPPEMKWALNLQEIDKPFIINSTNQQIIAQFTGSTKTENWNGKRVVLYFDPNVSFGGKLVGGIRARAPRGPAAAAPAAASTPAPAAPPSVSANAFPKNEADEDVPF